MFPPPFSVVVTPSGPAATGPVGSGRSPPAGVDDGAAGEPDAPGEALPTPPVGVRVTTTRRLTARASSLVPSTAGSVSPLPVTLTRQADRSASAARRSSTAWARCSDSVWL